MAPVREVLTFEEGGKVFVIAEEIPKEKSKAAKFADGFLLVGGLLATVLTGATLYKMFK